MEWPAIPQNRYVNRSSQDSGISCHKSSFSVQDSQGSDFSQVATQDMLSQNIVTPQPEPRKPTSMFEKWKNRQTMMKLDNTTKNMVVGRASSLPGSGPKMHLSAFGRWDSRQSLDSVPSHVNVSGRRRVDDYDERKLMDQMVSTIKDCNEDVKSSLLCLMEYLDKINDVSNEQLGKTMSSFLERVSMHEEALKKLIEEQRATTSSQCDVNVNLAKKDYQITTLQEELADAKQEKTFALKAEIDRFQAVFMDKLENLQKAKKNQDSDVLTDCLENIHRQQKQTESMFKSLKNEVKDSEKRIVAGLSKAIKKMDSDIVSQAKENRQEFKNASEIYKRDIQQSRMTDSVHKQDLDFCIKNLQKAIEQQFKGMLHSLEDIIAREIKQKVDQSKLLSHSLTSHGHQKSQVDGPIPVRMAPFVSPFQSQEHMFASRKGPSPYAVVMPQRQTVDVQTLQPYSEKRNEHQSLSSDKTKTKNKRKCVYTHKKKTSKKKCIDEVLSGNKIEPAQHLLSSQTREIGHIPQHHLQQSPSFRRNSLRNQGPNTKCRVNKAQDNSISEKALEAYFFDETSTEHHLNSESFIRPLHVCYSKPQTALQPEYRSFQTGMRTVSTPSFMTNENKLAPKLQTCKESDSLQSSPAVSVMDIPFHRKIKTPFRGFGLKRQQRGPSYSREVNLNWMKNMNSSPSMTLLSDSA